MRGSLRTTTIGLVAASVLALLMIFRTTVMRMLEEHPSVISLSELVHRVIPTWVAVVLVSPWCAFMARRFPLRTGGGTGRFLLAHLGGAAVFVALRMGLLMAFHAVMGGIREFPPGPQLLHTYLFYIVMEMSVYASIVLVILVIEARGEAAERALAAARLEQSLGAARLESLRAQIRPHFLFNTLNALAVLARKGDGAAVDRAIGDLGELLRASFDSPERDEIPLGEELALTERYVHLQSIRFPDRLEVDWRIDPETRSALVPPLLVQPLVENALEHGLATSQGGHIVVAARRDGDALELEVSDDGPGFRIASRERSTESTERNGVGLANARERLSLLYAARATLTCTDRPGGGALVRIRIPWRLAGEAERPA